jgi:hypothetical protein
MRLILFFIPFILFAGSDRRLQQEIMDFDSRTSAPPNPRSGKTTLFNKDGIFSSVDASGTTSRISYNPDNLLSNKNWDVEQGLTSDYTYTAGTITPNTITPLKGKESLDFDAVVQNDFVDTAAVLIPIGLFGQTCMAQFTMRLGDANLSAQVLNADNDIVGQMTLAQNVESLVITIPFTCPKSTATPNQRTLRIRVLQNSATNAALATLDDFYIGVLNTNKIGVQGASQWYYYTVNADINGNFPFPAPTASTNDGTLFTYAGTTLTVRKPINISINLSASAASGVSDLGATPICIISGVSRNFTNSLNMGTAASVPTTTNVTLNAGDTCVLVFFRNVQPIQRYVVNITATPIPQIASVVSSKPNNMSARITSAAVITTQSSTEFLNNCILNSAGDFTCNFKTPYNTIPACHIQTENNSATAKEFNIYAITTSAVSYRMFSDTNVLTSFDHNLKCDTQGFDYNPSVFAILPPQVQNSSQKNWRTESCYILNSGVASLGSTSCNTFIQSVSRTGLGLVTVNFIPNIFQLPPSCSAYPLNVNATMTILTSVATNAAISYLTMKADSGVMQDANLYLTCSGFSN